jgi:hypothetical protein
LPTPAAIPLPTPEPTSIATSELTPLATSPPTPELPFVETVTPIPLLSCNGCQPGETVGSWKFGLNLYYCDKPELIPNICSKQMEADVQIIKLTKEECELFQQIELGDDALPAVNAPDGTEIYALSNYVCYKPIPEGGIILSTKVDKDGCDVCDKFPLEPHFPDDLTKETDAPTPAATPLAVPTNNVVIEEEGETCSMDYVNHNNGNTVCPDGRSSVVQLQGSMGYDLSDHQDGKGIIYDINMNPENLTVTFSVNNIFVEDADVYVKHEVFSPIVSWYRQKECELVKAQTPCLESSSTAAEIDNTFTAACRERGYALVYLYFVTKDSAVLQFNDVVTPTIPECCYPEEYDDATTGVVEMTYKIECSCPPDDGSAGPVDVVVDADPTNRRRNLHHHRRNLRRSPKDPTHRQGNSAIFDSFHRRLRGDVETA